MRKVASRLPTISCATMANLNVPTVGQNGQAMPVRGNYKCEGSGWPSISTPGYGNLFIECPACGRRDIQSTKSGKTRAHNRQVKTDRGIHVGFNGVRNMDPITGERLV